MCRPQGERRKERAEWRARQHTGPRSPTRATRPKGANSTHGQRADNQPNTDDGTATTAARVLKTPRRVRRGERQAPAAHPQAGEGGPQPQPRTAHKGGWAGRSVFMAVQKNRRSDEREPPRVAMGRRGVGGGAATAVGGRTWAASIDLRYVIAQTPDIIIFFFIKEDDIFRGQSRQIMSQPLSLYLAKKIYHRGAPSFRGTMIDLLRDIGVLEGA